MEGENAKICPNCGSQVKEGASFCTSCGAAMAAPQEAPAPPPGPPAQQPQPPVPPAQAPVPPPPGTGPEMPAAPMAAAAPVAPSKRGKAPLIIGIIGGILVVAGIVVLVLWLAVWRGGEGGSGDPIALAEKYISALEKGDADAYFDCFEPDYFTTQGGSILEDMGMDIEELIKTSLEMADFNFASYALELQSEKGNEATVVTTSGTMTVSVMGYDQEIDLADDPLVFEMVKKDGKWYLTGDPSGAIMGSGMDYEDMDFEDMNLDDMNLDDMNMDELIPEDLNLQDLEQYLPEGYSLEDLQNMSPEELNQFLEDLMKLMDQIPQGESTGV